MKQVPDRKRLRREYLKAKTGAYVRGTIGATLLMPALLAFFLFGAVTVVLLMFMFAAPRFHPVSFGLAVLVAAALTLASGALVPWCWRARHAFRRASELPYVPPVTAATLPSDEILVRGSEPPPVAQSEVLLRAAQGVETPKEELLRVSQGE